MQEGDTDVNPTLQQSMSSCVPLPPTSLLGKRKRKKQPDPNPLFSKWLAEWRDEAKEKGWKSEFIYSKALRSLHKYPLPLATGKECKILQHFGDKICKMLDDRLLKYKQEQENQASLGCSASDTDALSGSLSSCAAQSRPKFPAEVHEISDNSDDEVVHQMTHASLPNGVHLGVPGTGSMAVKTAAGTASDSLKRTALMNIVSINEQCDEEVLIMGQTSPVMVDNWDVSDDDLPALPTLPDLSVGRPCVTKLRHSPVKKSKEEDVRAVGPAAAAVTITEVQRFSDSDGDEAGQVAPPQQTGGGAGVRRPREYVPAHRSGPYAILLTLFRQAQDPDFRGFMTKEELSRAAQPLADKSFTVADPGSRYTAWSSVSILIKKGFLTKESSPAKYRLTDQGYELAHRLEEAERRPVAGDPCGRRGGDGGEGGGDGGMAAGMRRSHQSPLAEIGTDGDISASPRPAKQVKRDSQKGREQEKKTSRGPLNNSGTCKDHPSYSNAAGEGRIFIASTTDFEKEKKGTSAKDACLLLDDLDKGVVGDHELHTRTNADIGKEKKETSANDACFLLDDLDKGVVGDCKLHTRTSADIGKERKETSANHVCIALDDLEMEVPGDSKLLPTKSVDTEEEEEEEKEASAKEAHLLVEDWDMSDDDADLPPLPLPSLAQRLKPAPFTPASVSAAVSQNSGGDRKLQYWYVADSDRLVTRKDQACVSLDEELGVGFLVKINYQHLLQSGSQYTLDMTRPLGDDYVFAYLSDIDCYEEAWPPVTCPESGPIKSQSAVTDADPGSRPTHSISDSDSDSEPDPLPSRPAASSVPTTSHKIPPSSHTSCAAETKLQRQESIPKPAAKTRLGTSAGNSATVPTVGPATSSQGSCSSAMPRVTSLPSSQSSTDSLRSASEDVAHFVLHPGSFEVVLCVDNREFYGSKSNSKSLLPDLIKNGVTCDLRLLNVGDLLWVAREKAAPGAPLGMMGNAQPARRELVLNYVVERKRMDDFVSSMIGGRLKEQKFRLKHSGLQEKIILIESYGSMDHFSISADRIRQAVANTEIIDGFTVKHTRDPRETAAYLTLMTRYLQSFYQNKTLRSCSQDSIKELGLKSDICDTEELLMPFDHFNQASLKNKPLTVKELFAKQLIQLWGMSAEKARAIVNKYPTPTSLFEAYAACMTDKERDSLLANLKYGKNLRNLGISLSRQVAQLYTSWVLT